MNFFSSIDSDIVFAQECRGLGEQKSIAAEYYRPFSGKDEYTAVLVRKSLCEQKSATNVSAEVREPLLEKLRGRSGAGGEYGSAWRATCDRIAAVKLENVPSLGGKSVIAASLHCSKSSGTADLYVYSNSNLERNFLTSIFKKDNVSKTTF